MFVKLKLKILLLLISSIFLNSCSLNYTIERKYMPQLNKLENTQNYSIFTKVNYTPIFTKDVQAVGVIKNGWGSEIGRIYLKEKVEDWILDSFQQELVKAGYLVNDKNVKNRVNITLNVKQFFVESCPYSFSFAFNGILIVEVKVEIPGDNKYYNRRFVSYAEESTYPPFVPPNGFFDNQIIDVAENSFPNIIKEVNILLTNKAGRNR